MGPWAILAAALLAMVWLISRHRRTRPYVHLNQRPSPLHHWPSIGKFDVDVVSDAPCTLAMQSVVEGRRNKRTPLFCKAELVPVGGRQRRGDVVVQVKGLTVGTLTQPDAIKFRHRLRTSKIAGQTTTCDALIVDATPAFDSQRTFEIHLDLAPFERSGSKG